MMLWLLKLLGVKEVTKWALRLVVLAVLAIVLLFAVVVLIFSPEARDTAVKIAGVGLALLAVPFLWALIAGRKIEPEAGERTIDGKVVPDKLAAVALAVPEQSPDGDYVLRGLPDYGKVLLRLNSADFEYVPVIPEKLPAPLPVEEPAVQTSGGGIPDWVVLTGTVALVVIAGMWIYLAQKGGSEPPAYRNNVAQPVAVEAQQVSAPTPPQTPAAAPVSASAPAHSSDPEGTYRDNTTGLLWPKKDNGPEPLESFQEAKDYCESLNIGGVTGWRLPSIDELNTIVGDSGSASELRWVGIHPSQTIELLWSSTPVPEGTSRRVMDISNGTLPADAKTNDYVHALCVSK